MSPLELYSVIELAKVHATVASILAGFSFSTIILLMERLSNRDTDKNYNPILGKTSLLFMTASLFNGIVASFTFAIVAGNIKNNKQAYYQYFFAVFPYYLSFVFMFTGLVLLISSFNIKYFFTIAITVLWILIIGGALQYWGTLQTIIASYENTSVKTLLNNSLQIYIYIIILFMGGVIGYLIRFWRWQRNKFNYNEEGIQVFLILSMIISSTIAFSSPLIGNDLLLFNQSIAYFTNILLAINIGGIITFIPKKSYMSD